MADDRAMGYNNQPRKAVIDELTNFAAGALNGAVDTVSNVASTVSNTTLSVSNITSASFSSSGFSAGQNVNLDQIKQETEKRFAEFQARYNEEFDFEFKKLTSTAQFFIRKADLLHASPGQMMITVTQHLRPVEKIQYEINNFINTMMNSAVRYAQRYQIPIPPNLTKMPPELPLGPLPANPSLFQKAGNAMYDAFSRLGDGVSFIPEKLGADYTGPNDDAITGIGATGLAVGALDNWIRNHEFKKAQTDYENQFRYFEIINNGLDGDNDDLAMIVRGLKTANNRVARTISVISSEVKRYEDMDLF